MNDKAVMNAYLNHPSKVDLVWFQQVYSPLSPPQPRRLLSDRLQLPLSSFPHFPLLTLHRNPAGQVSRAAYHIYPWKIWVTVSPANLCPPLWENKTPFYPCENWTPFWLRVQCLWCHVSALQVIASRWIMLVTLFTSVTGVTFTEFKGAVVEFVVLVS